MKNNVFLFLIIIILAISSYFVLLPEETPLSVGLFYDQKNLVKNEENFEVIYYNNPDEMRHDILSGKLDVFCCSAFELIKNKYQAKPIASVAAEYYLIGYQEAKTPEIGVFEKSISTILYQNLPQDLSAGANAIVFKYNDLKPYLKERVIDYAVFRSSQKYVSDEEVINSLNLKQFSKKGQIKVFGKISDLGYTADLICVSKKHLGKNDMVIRELYNSFYIPNLLPKRQEVEGVVNYLFKNGIIKNRINYSDLIYNPN